MSTNVEDKKLKILNILRGNSEALSSQKITTILNSDGIQISERTVRFHLLEMDKKGFTQYIGRKGRLLTPFGEKELSRVNAFNKVGFLSAKIDDYSYGMDFDIDSGKGNVLVNITLIEQSELKNALELITKVFENGFTMGNLLTLFYPDDDNCDIYIPNGFVGIGSVCSITLNGILLSKKIPVHSIFGGLLEIDKGSARRFVELIQYSGTSLDPLEVFISSGLTDQAGVCSVGSGVIGASFRDFPSVCRDKVIEILKRCADLGLGGAIEIGFPGSSLLEIPVSEGRVGFVVSGGLNAISLLAESGIKMKSKTLSGYVDYDKLFNYRELIKYIR
ncbi:MAG: hypothetical protein B6229_02715 [Spirochaetaceae bacterium 4572_7]|nr:MAG: hypothetical protein B6229_02715 [Spirochaetaceae bacterium 4572_7]